MEAKELRIGNTILYKGKIIDLSMVGLFQLYYASDTHTDSKTDKLQYEPIPLTEAWLLRLGFKEDGNSYSIDNPNGFALSKGHIESLKRVYFNSWSIMYKWPESVHQLQNLYFALTGLELTYEQN